MNPWLLLIAFVVGAASSWQVQNWRIGYMQNQAQEAKQEKDRFDRKAEGLLVHRAGLGLKGIRGDSS